MRIFRVVDLKSRPLMRQKRLCLPDKKKPRPCVAADHEKVHWCCSLPPSLPAFQEMVQAEYSAVLRCNVSLLKQGYFLSNFWQCKLLLLNAPSNHVLKVGSTPTKS